MKIIRFKGVLVASILALCPFTTQSLFACHVDDSAFSAAFRTDDAPPYNLAFNDYARILQDSEENSGCALNDTYALTAKLNDTNGIDSNGIYHSSADHSNVWNSWLSGASVGYIFAAANRIGANGFATQQLDTALRTVIAHFEFTGDPGCSKESGNNCVDDYSVDAPGCAWIAAYKYRRGDDSTSTQHYRDRANDMINSAFNEVCIRKNDLATPPGDPMTLCNGNVADLAAGNAHTLSVNHGPQMPSYGFGLMTSIANAELGLQASGSSHTYTPDQITIAQGLLTEMKNAVDPMTGEYSTTACVTINRDLSGVWTTSTGSDCGGPDHYKAGSYVLHKFYSDYLGGYPSGGYQSSSPDMTAFHLGDTQNDFFSWGRYLTYVTMASSWFNTPRREYLPFDASNPIGYFDSIDSNGLASGWSCDQDAPTHSNKVDLYSNGIFSATAYATLPSESAVNSACGGGTAHRFQAQLPPAARGTSIVAYGLDYTWYGFTQLPCSTTSCTWPDNPPTARFGISCAGSSCTANGTASTDDVGIAGYQWNWGDSLTGSGSSASHTFTTNGTFTVTLTVTDTIGQTGSTTHSVTVPDNPPVASFTIACTYLACTADGSASSDDHGISAYQWTWGDNLAGKSGSPASHTFAAAGTYVVTLTVSDTVGQTGSTTRTVTVAPCAGAAISTQPTSSPASITAGSSSTLTIGVTGSAPVTVQWYKGAGTAVGSGTSISVSPTQNTTYYAIVSNSCGTVQSSNVSVSSPPGLGDAATAAPSTITAGQVARLELDNATGQSLTYLWYKSDGTLVGSTIAKKLNVSPTVTTSYYYKVTNSCGTTGPSPTVTVTVN